MILVQEGLRRGCRMVLTHCDNPANFYTVEQQVEAVRWGAMIEHSYLTTLWGRTPIEEIARMIRATGCENVFLTTDSGQPKSPTPTKACSSMPRTCWGRASRRRTWIG